MVRAMSASTSARDRVRLAADCLEIAERASRLALAGYRRRPDVEEKAAHDLVTKYDLQSQELAVALLGERYPGVALVAEETADPLAPMPAGLSFTVDPIDGTTNFAHGHPFWCTAIAALFDGVPIAGAVVAPALSTRWHGHAPCDDGSAGLALRDGVPCAVSATTRLDRALVATGFPPDRSTAPANNFDSFMSVKKRARAVRRCGSAAIDVCFVVDGTYDAYWERRVHVWDVAAGGALLLAAGGRASAISGGPIDWARGQLVISNGKVHDELIEAIG